jgi:hypothetical protein
VFIFKRPLAAPLVALAISALLVVLDTIFNINSIF